MSKCKRVAVSLLDIIEVRRSSLCEPEIWSVLCQTAMKLQDISLHGSLMDSCLQCITPDSLMMSGDGNVTFEKTSVALRDYCAPDHSALCDTDVEKSLIYSLGKTLRYASLYTELLNQNDDHSHTTVELLTQNCPISAALSETLNFMLQENKMLRHSLASLFQVISRYIRVGIQMNSFVAIIMKMCEEITGSDLEFADSEANCDYETNANLAKGEIVNGVITSSRIMEAKESNKKQNAFKLQTHSVALISPSESVDDGKRCIVTEAHTNHLTEQLNNLLKDSLAVHSSANKKTKIWNQFASLDAKHKSPSNTEIDSKQHSRTDVEFVGGPEFVVKSRYPCINLRIDSSDCDAGELNIVTVVSLTGQRYEVIIDSSKTTAGDIFHVIADHEQLREKFLFGLACLKGDEFLFFDLDSNFYKLAASYRKLAYKSGFSHFDTLTLYFRVKFYVDLTIIRLLETKRMYYLQLRKDILEERISCHLQSSLLVASLAIRIECGNKVHSIETMNLEHYLQNWIFQRSDLHLVKKQLVELLESFEGSSDEELRELFICHVQRLRDYGCHFHVVHREKKNPKSVVLLGVSLNGISIFAPVDNAFGENKQELQRYSWQSIARIVYEKHHFSLTIQSRNLKNHFMKCRFYTDNDFGKYLFNLTFAHHWLHLRLVSRRDLSMLSSPDAADSVMSVDADLTMDGGESVQDLLGSLNKINIAKTRRSKSLKELNFLQRKKSPTKSPSLIVARSSYPAHDASPSGKRVSTLNVLATLFKKQNGFGDNSVRSEVQGAYVIDTSIRSQPGECSAASRCNDSASTILKERFANLTGLDSVSKVFAVTVARDESGCLGMSVCEGADSATYVQSVADRHLMESQMRPGDRIVAIDGRNVESESFKAIVALLQNTPHVRLTLLQNIDQLEDDVFESETPELAGTEKTVSKGSANVELDTTGEVTYRCHDVDFRNDISVCMAEGQLLSRLGVPVTLATFERGENSPLSVGEKENSLRNLHNNENDNCSVKGRTREKSLISSMMKETVCYSGCGGSSPVWSLEDVAEEDRRLQLLGDVTCDRSGGVVRRDHTAGSRFCLKQQHRSSGDYFSEVRRISTDRPNAVAIRRGVSAERNMVTKQDESSEDAAELCRQQRHTSVGISPDGTDSANCPWKAVLWSPRHSGTVMSKVCDIESHGTRHHLLSPSIGGSEKPVVPKSKSLQRFSSEEYDQVSAGGKWCSAVTAKTYRPRNVIQLARSKTLPAVVSADDNRAGLDLVSKSMWVSRNGSPQCQSVASSSGDPETRSSTSSASATRRSVMSETPSFKPRLSLSCENIGETQSLVAIAKAKLRRFSGVSEQIVECEGMLDPLRVQNLPKKREDVLLQSLLKETTFQQIVSKFPFIRQSEIFQVSIRRSVRGLGMSIHGGKDQDPDDELMQLIRVKRLYPLQPAAESGMLAIGDILLTANGRHLTGLNHKEVVDTLHMTLSCVNLVACRPPVCVLPPVPQSSGLANTLALSLSSLNLLGLASTSSIVSLSQESKEFELIMEKWNGSLGFSLHQREKPQNGYYVKALVKDPALSDGRLRPGDHVVKVNGTDISGMSHGEAINFIRAAPDVVTLLVCRSAEPLSPPSPLFASSLSEHNDRIMNQEKKALRKEAQDLLFAKDRRQNADSLSVSPMNRRRRRNNRIATTGNINGDSTDTLSSASEVDSRRETPSPCGSHVDFPNTILKEGFVAQKNFPSYFGEALRRPPLPPAVCVSDWDTSGVALSPVLLRVDLHRTWVTRLGFSLTGLDERIFIRAIHPGGLANQDGRLRSGDRVLKVNGIAVDGMTADAVIEMLRSTVGDVSLDVLRDPAETARSSPFP